MNIAEEANNDRNQIIAKGDIIIQETNNDKANLDAHISNITDSGIKEQYLNASQEAYNEAASKIRETIRTAIDLAANETNESVSLLLMTNGSIFAAISVLFRLYFNNNVKYLLSLYYETHKKRINLIYIPLVLIILLIVYYCLPVIYCDAPRA
jgi:2-succinyl-5-enolpyruvyl-6-hydroxy-3-cyclohexene-1-carboxylate synthase